MTTIPDDLHAIADRIAAKANDCCGRRDGYEEEIFALVAEALMHERQKQRDRAVKMLVGIADVLAGHMVNQATPELLKALADAVKSSDGPDQTP